VIADNVEQGEVLLLRFLYSNMVDYKIRPALVISNNGFNKMHDAWFCPITSKKVPQSIPIASSLAEGKLERESFANTSHIATVERDLILKRIGKLSKEKTREIIAGIMQNME